MTEGQAVLALIVLGIGAAVISRRYLSPELRTASAVISLIGSLATFADGAS